MRLFENHVQKIKNEVYSEVSKLSFEGRLSAEQMHISDRLNPGPDPRFRCCIYHERAVTNERVRSTICGIEEEDNVIEVLSSACDGCMQNRYAVTDSCRGCIAHRCMSSCPVDAISILNNKAYIDNEKCIECGKCKDACPYNAIADVMRPCIKACPVGAICVGDDGKAIINDDKCLRCGACVYYCPFGALQDRSQIVQVIDRLNDSRVRMLAMVAPSLADSFGYTEVGRIVSAIKELGFSDVVEVALGADLVIQKETEELMKVNENGGVMTSSCCPSFVNLIKKNYPELEKYISGTVSPMVATANLIKSTEPDCEVVFIGPCIAKKEEMAGTSVDYVLTFEELSGMIDLDKLSGFEVSPLNNASYHGRKFAISSGVSKAVENHIRTLGAKEDFEVIVCDGIDECDRTLKLLRAGRIKNAFIEGMACKGGCVKGPVSIHYGKTSKKAFEDYCRLAKETDTSDSTRVFDVGNIQMNR